MHGGVTGKASDGLPMSILRGSGQYRNAVASGARNADNDPTLPRCGTDPIPRKHYLGQNVPHARSTLLRCATHGGLSAGVCDVWRECGAAEAWCRV